jgi:type II secretory pathway component PulK
MRARGSVLIVVLFVMSTLSLVALGVAYRGSLEMRISNQRAISERLGALAGSAVSAELNELATRTDDFDHPAQMWSSHAPWNSQEWFSRLVPENASPEDYLVDAYISDEESKLNVLRASGDALEKLGMTSQQVADLMDWMTPGESSEYGGAKSAYYQQLPHPYRVKGAPVELMNELLMVRSFDLSSILGDFASLSPDISRRPTRSRDNSLPLHGLLSVLTTATDKINLNTAAEPVLETLPISSAAVQQIIGYRSFDANSSGKLEDHAFRSISDIDQLQGLSSSERTVLRGIATFKSHHFTILVRATHRLTKLSYCVRVYAVDGDSIPAILQWDVIR